MAVLKKVRAPSSLVIADEARILSRNGRGGCPFRESYSPRPNFGWKVTPNDSRMLFCVWLLKRVMR